MQHFTKVKENVNEFLQKNKDAQQNFESVEHRSMSCCFSLHGLLFLKFRACYISVSFFGSHIRKQMCNTTTTNFLITSGRSSLHL